MQYPGYFGARMMFGVQSLGISGLGGSVFRDHLLCSILSGLALEWC